MKDFKKGKGLRNITAALFIKRELELYAEE